jgi:glycosyltransferase involved in cell wall biosynthesis
MELLSLIGHHELAPGVILDDVMAALADASHDAPSPVDQGPEFLRWIAEPEFAGYAPIARYFAELRRRRHDLLVAYPEVPGRDAGRYSEWVEVYGCAERHLPAGLFAPAPPRATAHEPYTQAGVNLVGLLNAELGVGEVARRLEQALRVGDIPHVTTPFERTRSRLRSTYRSEPPRFDTNLLCLNADSLPGFTQDVGLEFFEDRYTIGVWFWETSTFPSMFHTAFATVDELWAASDYIADILRAAAPPELPVVRMPLPIVTPAIDEAFDPTSLGVPADRFTFLCSFDYLSVPGRKNPLGTIDAFIAAFAPDEGPVLVVKSINAAEDQAAAHALREATQGRRDIVLFDGYLDSRANASLTAGCGCYVSLHRSEGFGLNLADALALGVPLIATGATGNMEFCRAEDCFLVAAEPTRVGPGHFPYDADATWMEPSVEDAARLMRLVFAAPHEARERARRARDRVLAENSMQRTATFMRDRIAIARADKEVARQRAELDAEAAVPAPVSRRTALLRSLGLARPR